MKSIVEKEKKTFDEDYDVIMKDFQKQNVPTSPAPQWTNPGDFIIKFSLFQETPNSITSTDTSIIIGI
jgi:hypothetical protein